MKDMCRIIHFNANSVSVCFTLHQLHDSSSEVTCYFVVRRCHHFDR